MIICGSIVLVRGEGSSVPGCIECVVSTLDGEAVVTFIPDSLWSGEGDPWAFRGRVFEFDSTVPGLGREVGFLVEAIESATPVRPGWATGINPERP